MQLQPTFVSQLLQLYHRRPSAGAPQQSLPTIKQAEYLCEIGLGPIAFQVYGNALKSSDPEVHSKLQSAALTARVIYRQLENATIELARELQIAGVVPTLLKGISASDEFYDPPYLRLMGDVDILIQSSEVDLVWSKVKSLGYEITDEQWQKYREHGQHHLPQARHPKSGVFIEVHTGLFGSAECYSGEYVFRPDNMAAHSMEFEYRGIRVARFTPEFQFIYTVSKWSVDTDWSNNLKNINDTIHILRKYQSEFDWPTLSKWFAASPHLYPIVTALLNYLEQVELLTISPQLRETLTETDRKLGPRKLKTLMWILHTYPFNARNKNGDSFQNWFAHAFWMFLTKPSSRDLGIPREIMRQFCTNAVYGKYNPFRCALLGLKEFVYRIMKKLRHRKPES